VKLGKAGDQPIYADFGQEPVDQKGEVKYRIATLVLRGPAVFITVVAIGLLCLTRETSECCPRTREWIVR
jgi:hypothetical protein